MVEIIEYTVEIDKGCSKRNEIEIEIEIEMKEMKDARLSRS